MLIVWLINVCLDKDCKISTIFLSYCYIPTHEWWIPLKGDCEGQPLLVFA